MPVTVALEAQLLENVVPHTVAFAAVDLEFLGDQLDHVGTLAHVIPQSFVHGFFSPPLT
jgi:hypothetical protein